MRTSFSEIAASAAPAVALAIALGRIGCLLAGCCFGRPTLFPIALIFEHFDAAARPLGVPLHATQLYEAGACLALAALLWTRPRAMRAPALLLGHGLIRTLMESLRADYRGQVAGLAPTTWVSLGLIVVGVLWLIQQRSAWLGRAPREAVEARTKP